MTIKALTTLTYVLTFLLGATTLYGTQLWENTDAAQAKLEKAKTDARSAWQKYYDLQESMQDEIYAAQSTNAVELWNAQQELEKCRKAKGT